LLSINQEAFQLAVGAENEAVRASMCKYIRDDFKGRHDVTKAFTGVNINFLQFNEQLVRAKAAVNKALGKPIEV